MLAEPYLWFKYFHLVSLIAWMAGLFYLPRLYVYHADAEVGSAQSETFKVMERRLLRAITTPAMISTFIFGLAMMHYVDFGTAGWLHAKLALVLVLAGFHGYLAYTRKQFERDSNTKSARFFRWLNEVPTVLLLAIIFLAVFKPF